MAKTLYYNGTIITMSGSEPESAEAVLTENDKILAVGSLEAVQAAAESGKHQDTPILKDLKGAVMLPAFIDSHSHITAVARVLSFAMLQEAESFDGKKVIIRTLDIGADKQVDYFNLDKEENPALGYRAIRICLTRPEIFKTQLRALYRAAVYGNLSIMFPMIISVSEVKKIKEIIAQVQAELKAEGIPYKEDVELGVMIETPAAVMISRELAKEVDFFSVGTNDLTQYTLAIDRQNQKLDTFYDPHHPAVLAMIKMAADNAHAEGKWIGICGELGADLELTEEFLKMGLDELSVSPALVLPLRKRIRECE